MLPVLLALHTLQWANNNPGDTIPKSEPINEDESLIPANSSLGHITEFPSTSQLNMGSRTHISESTSAISPIITNYFNYIHYAFKAFNLNPSYFTEYQTSRFAIGITSPVNLIATFEHHGDPSDMVIEAATRSQDCFTLLWIAILLWCFHKAFFQHTTQQRQGGTEVNYRRG